MSNQEQNLAPNNRKTILISGAGSGIGKATALLFLQEGYNISFCDYKEDNELLNELVASKYDPERYVFSLANVKERKQINSWVQASIAKFKRIDALFVNAGKHASNSIFNVTEQDLDDLIHTNVYGAIYTIQACIPYLKESSNASIILNGSDQFFIGKNNNFAYGLTKGALGQMTRSLAVELSPFKIRVNSVNSGTIRTPLSEDAIARYAQRANLSLEQAWQEENSLFCLNRVGEASEVAQMVYFLVEKGTFCTGAHYLVDGGIVCH